MSRPREMKFGGKKFRQNTRRMHKTSRKVCIAKLLSRSHPITKLYSLFCLALSLYTVVRGL